MLRLSLWAAVIASTATAQSYYPNPCISAPYSGQPWCDPSLPLPTRVADLVSRLPLADKIGMTTTWSGGSTTLNMAAYDWWSEALHGIADSPAVNFQGTTPWATSFPQVCLTAASFNRTLFNIIGQTIATEARAFANQGNAGNTFWAPNINVFRDPRWGRGQEVAGEDPYVLEEYVVNFVRGLQEGEDPRYIKASACCKHYTAYDLEDWDNVTRHEFNAIVTPQDLYDTFQPPFQACVADARASGIMCSYNEVNGVPSCADPFLLQEVLRTEWGFDGYVTSDCGAVTDILDSHHYTNTTDETCAVTIPNGLDIGCDGFLPQYLAQAIQDGAVTEAQLDVAMQDLFSVRYRLGHFDPPDQQPYLQIPPSVICTPESVQLTYDAAAQGIVLLQKGALPLSAGSVSRLAVIGPNANSSQMQLGNYYGVPCFNQTITPVQGLSAYASVEYVQGCDISTNNTSQFNMAAAAAANANATILVVGLDQSIEAEGLDRTSLAFPGVQLQLVSTVCAASVGPCIVIVLSGGPVDMSPIFANPDVSAIMWAGYPGPQGGVALADAIFGKVVPSGRTTTTVYPAAFASNVSMFEMGMRPGASIYPPYTNPGRTYRFFTGQAVVPFGTGLSYTTFQYSPSQAFDKTVSMKKTRNYLAQHSKYHARYAPLQSETTTNFWVNVTNTGTIDADDTVLGYVTPPGAGTQGVPLKYLFGYQRVHVPAGQTVTVWLGLSARDLTQVNADGLRVAWPGHYKVQFGTQWEGADVPMGFLEHEFDTVA